MYEYLIHIVEIQIYFANVQYKMFRTLTRY
jgi:hypothetical protein